MLTIEQIVWSITVIMVIKISHWLGDFPAQSNNMATKKSSSIKWLFLHSLTYTGIITIPFVLFGFVFNCLLLAISLALANGILHFLIDYVSSKFTSQYYKENRIHDFFVIIGLDQYIHDMLLISSSLLLLL